MTITRPRSVTLLLKPVLVLSWLLIAFTTEGVPAETISGQFFSRTTLIASVPVQVTNMPGELEIAVSPDGEQALIGLNFPRGVTGFSNQILWFSADGGQSFQPSNPGAGQASQRDPTVAWAGSNAFYFATMGSSKTVLVSRSLDGGQNFTARTASGCGTRPNCLADQPHLAADPRPCIRNTTGLCDATDSTRSSNQDELYVIWRDIGVSETPIIECSSDSGNTWQFQQAAGVGLLPRITTGPDGFVYAIGSSRRDGTGRIKLQKFSSCRAGLTSQFTTPIEVTTFENVECPVPGLDRCNSGNILSSPMVAIDRANPQLVYVAFATHIGPANEEIRVMASSDGGKTFGPALAAHSTQNAVRRFLPWACGGKDEVFLGWYDRRNASLAQIDATDYVVNRLHLDTNGLSRLKEISASGATDFQCGNNWPLAPRDPGDSESCSVQPQNAGLCFQPASPLVACNVNAPCAASQVCRNNVCGADTTTRCDFSNGCGGTAICSIGSGIAKYGDYNGIACSNEAAFVAWASTVASPGSPPVSGLSVFIARIDRISEPLMDFCRSNPSLCADRPSYLPGKIKVKCSQPGCSILDPIPEICQRALDCPGCPPGQLCALDYLITIDGLGSAWKVQLIDEMGNLVLAKVSISGNRTSIRFRPSTEAHLNRLVGRYFLVFQMTRLGKPGVTYDLSVQISRP